MSSNGTPPIPNLVKIPRGYAALNPAGMDLANLAAWHQERIGQMGTLAIPPEGATGQPLGSPPNPVTTTQRPWVSEPMGSVPFDEQGELALGGLVVGVDTVVMQFKVPQGFDGVIKWISNNLIGGTFAPGDLIWKITVNNRAVRNFGFITQEKGTITQGRQVSPIRIFSGDLVGYAVQAVTGAATGMTVCSLSGYFYPSKGIS